MDHRSVPCPDEDFSGYVPGKSYTGEHKMPWPPPSVPRHPSTIAEPLFAFGCLLVMLVLSGFSAFGLLTMVRWLF
jgi:hypothetical protein